MQDQILAESNDKTKPELEIKASRLFTAWLGEQNGSLAFTTYQAGRIFMIGVKPNGHLNIYQRSFPRPMGIGVGEKGTIWVSGLEHMWRFENFFDEGMVKDGCDALYVPVASRLTGDIDVHDVTVDAHGDPWFAATRFNTIATLDDTHSFVPTYLPPFVDRLAAEDRCHLNGIAMYDGRVGFATTVSQTNVAESWREPRRDGGTVLDINSNEIIVDGLSMPHSPRWHDGRLWLIDSGSGMFGYIDMEKGAFEPVCFLAGFARGLSILGQYAVIGVSSDRHNETFQGLALGEKLAKERAAPFVGLAIINLETGDMEHRLSITGVISEIYDCAFVPNFQSPALLGLKSNETRFMLRPAPM